MCEKTGKEQAQEIEALAKSIVVGQECICPHGLGRVVAVSIGAAYNVSVTVSTYINDRRMNWGLHQLELIPIPGRELPPLNVLAAQLRKERAPYLYFNTKDGGIHFPGTGGTVVQNLWQREIDAGNVIKLYRE